MFYADRVQFRVTTAPGTGTITCGVAVTSGIQGDARTLAQVSAPEGIDIPYLLVDGHAWEIGTGRYTISSNTLVRTLVSSSTNSLINASATAIVSVILPSSVITAATKFLTADASINVSTTGNDTTGSLTTPFASVAGAMNYIAKYDCAGFSVTINVADGTYNGSFNLLPMINHNGAVKPQLLGNHTTPDNVVFDLRVAGGALNTTGAIHQPVESIWSLDGFQIKSNVGFLSAGYKGMLFIETGNQVTLNFVPGGGSNAFAISLDTLCSLVVNGAPGIVTKGSTNPDDYGCLLIGLGGYNKCLLNGLNVTTAISFSIACAYFQNGGQWFLDNPAGLVNLGNLTGSVGVYLITGSSMATHVAVTAFSFGGPVVQDASGAYEDVNIGFEVGGADYTTVYTPTTGSTIAMLLNQGRAILTPATPLPALTIHLPPLLSTLGVNAFKTVTVSSTQPIFALTVASTDGSTVLNAPTTMPANNCFAMVWDAYTNTWYPSGGGAETNLPTTFTPAANETAIRAALLAASLVAGTVYLPDATVTLTSALPCYAGITVIGVPPVLAFSGGLTEADWSFGGGGSVFVGNGTFAGFAANNTTKGSPDANFLDNAIAQFTLRDVGFQNFTHAVDVGAHNNVGFIFSRLENLYALSCTDFGFNCVNFHHLLAKGIYTNLCTHGQRYAQDLIHTVLSMGNSTLQHLVNQGIPANMLNRGMVFEGINGGILDELTVIKVQQITFNRAQISQTATFNGTTTVAVTDGSKFAVGLPVSFTTASFGIAAAFVGTRSLTYVVKSVVGNNLTLALSKGGATFSASGSGTLTITSWGMPCCEAGGGDATSSLNNSHFIDMDIESHSEAVLYAQNASALHFNVRQAEAVEANVGAHFVGRNASYCDVYAAAPLVTDIDTGTTIFNGTRGTTLQFSSVGLWIDQIRNTHALSITGLAPDIESHTSGGSNFLSPQTPIAQFGTFVVGTGFTLIGSQAGYLSCATASATYALPTIQNTGGAAATANVGMQFVIDNNTSGTITINTDGTQLLNAVATSTGIVIPKGQCVKFTAMQGSSFYWLVEQVIKSGIKNVVADLPTPSVALAGFRMLVTNALAPAFGSAVASGGAITTPVVCTGSAWNVG